MKNKQIPNGYQTVMPYLIVDDAAGLLRFMEAVFGAKEKYKEMRPEDPEVIRHAEVTLDESVIMFAQATEQWKASPASLFVYVKDADTAYEKALATGAFSVMAPADQSYGRSCGVRDPYGNTWWATSLPS